MTFTDHTGDPGREPIVSFADTARRMRRFASALGAFTVLLIGVRAAASGQLTFPLVAETFGLILLAALFGEVVIVGTATIRGARRAARQGQRLSQADVALVPPQLGRWLNRRFNAPGPQNRS